jgi:hypothetical protein
VVQNGQKGGSSNYAPKKVVHQAMLQGVHKIDDFGEVLGVLTRTKMSPFL